MHMFFPFVLDLSVMLNSMLDLSVIHFMLDIWTDEHVARKLYMFEAIWARIGPSHLEQDPKLDA